MSTGLSRSKWSVGKILMYPVRLTKPRRVLFDHLPKCGGSTVTKYLYKQYRSHQIFQINGRRPHDSVVEFCSLPEKIRHQYRLILGHLAHELLDEVHADTISITILREPIDRIISHYYYVLRDTGHYLHQKVIDQNMDLKAYVTSGLSFELCNWYTTHFSGWKFDQAKADPERAVQIAFDTIEQRYDLVGFLDNLEELMNQLKNLARYKVRFENDLFNKTSDRPSREEIDPSTIELIRKSNAIDIELYSRLKTRF